MAVGSHLQGLRVPNSYVDVNHPEGDLGDRYFRGSGTSEAAAITSGAIALILQKYPNMTPDQVKAFIRSDAYRPSNAAAWSTVASGRGELALAALATDAPPWYSTQYVSAATGTGSLEAARGY